MDRLDELKAAVEREVDLMGDTLASLSRQIHAHPELGFREFQAVRWLGEYLQVGGFSFEASVAGLPTAFRATYRGSRDRPRVAFLAEYDALPGLGHACGHNLICVASVGAALALRAAVPDLPGTILVLGTPSEEAGGGKIIMVDQGAFDGVDAAMMFHPSRKNWFARGALAAVPLTMRFHGRAAHASAMPEKGINALEALIQAFVGINALRQHVTSDVRIHGIITHGGDAANIVPAFTEGEFLVRASTRRTLGEVLARVKHCAEGAATATGARVEFEEGQMYAERRNNPVLARFFTENIGRLGVEEDEPPAAGGLGSSDIGNVSLHVPTIHPYLKIAPDDVSNHTAEFAQAAASEAGFRAMLLAAKGLAMTALDIVCRDGASDEIWAAFEAAQGTVSGQSGRTG